MIEYEFEVEVTAGDAVQFAEWSGDWNPLHTDENYAASSSYHRTILHGAYSAGLFSRMAGMHIPGRECLLHGIKLKFIAPIFPPTRLRVRGLLKNEYLEGGSVDVTITDCVSGALYVD